LKDRLTKVIFRHYKTLKRFSVTLNEFNVLTAVFVYHADRLVGFGRAISDGVYQAAIYDCAVLPEFQRMGIGTTIMKNILLRISHCNAILYASPGKEGFYQTHGFRKMKTGMAHFKKGVAMRERGFTE